MAGKIAIQVHRGGYKFWIIADHITKIKPKATGEGCYIHFVDGTYEEVDTSLEYILGATGDK